MTRKAFTLIELLVVVAVLALLASMVFSNLSGAREGARITNILSFQSQTHSLLGSDLVGWWNFNEGDARDISGYNNHGTIVGATHVEGVPGTGGSALNFNGSSNYVDVGNKADLNLTNRGTIFAWVYLNSYNPVVGSYPSIVGKGAHAGWDTAGYTLWVRYDTNTVHGNIASAQSVYDTVSFGSPATGTWHHLAYTWNGSFLNAYLNGVQYGGNVTQNQSANSSSANFIIGRAQNGGQFFNGLIDDVRIYSRALTASEIQTLYAQTKDNYLANE